MLPSVTAAFALETKLTTKEQQVVDLLKAIETGAPEPVAVIDATKYVQHNLSAGRLGWVASGPSQWVSKVRFPLAP